MEKLYVGLGIERIEEARLLHHLRIWGDRSRGRAYLIVDKWR